MPTHPSPPPLAPIRRAEGGRDDGVVVPPAGSQRVAVRVPQETHAVIVDADGALGIDPRSGRPVGRQRALVLHTWG